MIQKDYIDKLVESLLNESDSRRAQRDSRKTKILSENASRRAQRDSRKTKILSENASRRAQRDSRKTKILNENASRRARRGSRKIKRTIDGVYDPQASARENIAGLIRAHHSGRCSGEPAGIRYPGVPSVEDVVDKLGIDPDKPMTEEQWYDAHDVLGVD